MKYFVKFEDTSRDLKITKPIDMDGLIRLVANPISFTTYQTKSFSSLINKVTVSYLDGGELHTSLVIDLDDHKDELAEGSYKGRYLELKKNVTALESEVTRLEESLTMSVKCATIGCTTQRALYHNHCLPCADKPTLTNQRVEALAPEVNPGESKGTPLDMIVFSSAMYWSTEYRCKCIVIGNHIDDAACLIINRLDDTDAADLTDEVLMTEAGRLEAYTFQDR